MPVSQLLTRWPSASRVFIDYRLACVGCPLNRFHDPLQVVQIYHLMPHNFFSDLVGGKPKSGFKNPIHLVEYWSTVTKNGVRGDPTKATAEKGSRILAAAANELVEIISELKERTVRKRAPHQSNKQ